MARKATRNTHKQIRWDANTGGMVPDFHFQPEALIELAKISADSRFAQILKSHCGNFLLQHEQDANKPTSGDYGETLDDLQGVTSNFLDRLNKLRGHELERVIDSAWYEATKKLPEYEPLLIMANMFLKQVRVAQNYLEIDQGRATSTEALRDLVSNCRNALTACGLSEDEASNQTRPTVRICIKGMGKSHLLERLRHYY
jgi:hypothetical protein